MGRETSMPSRLISFPEDNQGFFRKLFECLPHKEEQLFCQRDLFICFLGGWRGEVACLCSYQHDRCFGFLVRQRCSDPQGVLSVGRREGGKVGERGLGGGEEEKRLRFFLFSFLGLFPGPFDWPKSTFFWNSSWSLHERKQSRTQRKRPQCRLNKGKRERFLW